MTEATDTKPASPVGTGADTGKKAPGQRFVALDALRGFAALVVVLLHYDLTIWQNNTGFSLITRSSSYLAVDFFIVLSGFVLAHAFYERPGFNMWEYTKKRIFRFWPLHLLTLAATVAIMLIGGEAFSRKALLFNVFLLHNIGIGDWGVAFNIPSWSLSVELAVNIVIGLFLLMVPDRRLNGVLMALMALLAGALVFFTKHNLNAHGENVFGFLNVGLMRGFMDFPLGILMYRVFKAHRAWFQRTSALRTSLIGLILLAFVASFYVHGYSEWDFVWVPVYALVVLMLADPGPVWTRLLVRLRFFGDISFSLYLVHFVVIRAMTLVKPWPTGYWPGMALALGASVLLAWLLHHYFERPLYDRMVRRWCRKGGLARQPGQAAMAKS